VLPFLGLDRNTKAILAKRRVSEPSLLHGEGGGITSGNDVDYMALSPNAPYDSSRNQRILDKKSLDK